MPKINHDGEKGAVQGALVPLDEPLIWIELNMDGKLQQARDALKALELTYEQWSKGKVT
jgi:hypothetical protein